MFIDKKFFKLIFSRNMNLKFRKNQILTNGLIPDFVKIMFVTSHPETRRIGKTNCIV